MMQGISNGVTSIPDWTLLTFEKEKLLRLLKKEEKKLDSNKEQVFGYKFCKTHVHPHQSLKGSSKLVPVMICHHQSPHHPIRIIDGCVPSQGMSEQLCGQAVLALLRASEIPLPDSSWPGDLIHR